MKKPTKRLLTADMNRTARCRKTKASGWRSHRSSAEALSDSMAVTLEKLNGE